MHELWRDRLLGALARWSFRHRVVNLVVCVLLAVVCVVVAVSGLGFQPDRNALLNPELDWNQRFLAWREAFGQGGDLLVVVDTADADGRVTSASASMARAAIDLLGYRLLDDPLTASAQWRVRAGEADPRLLRIAGEEAWEEGLAGLDVGLGVLRAGSLQGLLLLGDGVGGGVGEAEGLQLARLVEALADRYVMAADRSLGLFERLASADGGYFATENGRLLLMAVRPLAEAGSLAPYEKAIGLIRSEIEAVRAALPGVQMGLTGIEAIESDETDAAVADATRSSVLAAVLVVVVLVVAYRGVVLPGALLVTLGVTMAWSFGFTTVAIGHLQVISVVFAAILLGLGADFGVHLMSSLARRLPGDQAIGEKRFERALVSAFRSAGPGLVTGGLTTSLAFATTALTDFTGVAEMGLIACSGVLLALVATLVLLPGMLWWSRHHLAGLSRHRSGSIREGQRGLSRVAGVVAFLGGVVVVGSAYVASSGLRFDYDLLKLLPAEVESVDWQRRIIRDGERTVWYAVSRVGSVEEAGARVRALRGVAEVGELGGVGVLFREDADRRKAQLLARRVVLDGLGEPGPLISEDPEAGFAEVDQWVATVATLASFDGDSVWGRAVLSAAGRWSEVTGGLDTDERAVRTLALGRDLNDWRGRIAREIERATSPRPLGVEELPAVLRDRAVALDGSGYAIEVYPRLPEGVTNALDPGFLPGFIGAVRGVDPSATGVIVQVYESGRLIQRAYVWAGLVSLVAVFVVVVLDLRSLVYGLLAMLPVMFGALVGGAVLVVFDVPLTPASVIGLPLLFGVGVDSGVHLLHRYKLRPHARYPGLTDGTGWSIGVTGLLTLIGFGSLLIASHRGMVGLGLVMTLGLGLTLVACFVVVPAVLRMLSRG
ncbi:MMPL family transporter [Mucisphaera sp.]|uniref:MMPL family transporter n=1 Tax=Mucisphaera sp. TaxID=2913024 RepID=UPI003D106943